MEGIVKWFNNQKGYGFIAGDDGEEYFVHFTALKEGTHIRDNDRVSFEPKETDKGKQAQDVALLQKGSEIAQEESSESQEEAQPEDSEDFSDEDAQEEPSEEEAKESA